MTSDRKYLLQAADVAEISFDYGYNCLHLNARRRLFEEIGGDPDHSPVAGCGLRGGCRLRREHREGEAVHDRGGPVLRGCGRERRSAAEARGSGASRPDERRPRRAAAGRARIADIQQSIDTYRASAQTTKADYAKITALSGVAEYKTYANMMIAALD